MLSDFEERLKEEIAKVRKEEEVKREKALSSLQADCDVKYDSLSRQFNESEERNQAKRESLLAEIESLKE
jgi:hypothetical protein